MKLFNGTYRPDARPARFLSALVVSGISYGLYKGVQDNYLVEILGITPFERGIVEFWREIPGLLVVFILAAMSMASEFKIFKRGLIIMLLGIAALLFLPVFKFFVVAAIVLFSVGEHIIMPVRNTISLDFAQAGKGGAALGITSTINNLGNIAGYLLVTLIFFLFARAGFERADIVPFKSVFIFSSVLLFAAALIALGIREKSAAEIKKPRRRFYFARKFKKYYMLEVFYGARKQIFLTFAPLVLIKEYGADASIIALLLAICACAGMVFSPLVGRLIDRLGFKIIMVSDTLILVAVCFFYGFSHRIFTQEIAFIAVSINFVLDSILSLGSMATNVYVQSISDSQEEITATLSTGISVNHFISIFIALFGGLIWNITGIEILFSISALLGILNSIYAASIKTNTCPA